MIRVGILGYHGRMGQLIAREIVAHKGKGCILAAGADHVLHPDAPVIEGVKVSSNAEDVVAASDVVIDFTVAAATPQHALLAAKLGKAFMSGTTGLDENGATTLHQAAKQIPVLYARNTSLSLAATKRVVALAAQLLAPFDYDIAILDEHHRMKKDAPSGTALVLGEAVKAANGGVRHPTYAAIRSGSIVGEHEVQFAGDGEVIRIRHSVTDRSIFARGAVQAALWLHGKPAGFYGMDDVLGM